MTDRLVTWADKFGGRSLLAHALTVQSSTGDAALPAAGTAKAPVAIARVNHGRWIADCPFGCGGAEYVNLDDPVFFCCECRNRAVDHHPVKVELPDKKRRDRIEQLLAQRPIGRRHWQPGETVGHLETENELLQLIGEAA